MGRRAPGRQQVIVHRCRIRRSESVRREDFEDLLTKIRSALPEDPIPAGTYPLRIKGCIALVQGGRAAVVGDGGSFELTGVIGEKSSTFMTNRWNWISSSGWRRSIP